MPALFVFDLDGTLVDSSQDLADAGNAVLEIYERPVLPRQQVAAMVGDGARELVRRLIAAAGIDTPLDEALANFLECYDQRLLATTRPYDGVFATLGEVVEFYDLGGGPRSELKKLGLSAGEKRALVAFLESLSGDPVVVEALKSPAYQLRAVGKN